MSEKINLLERLQNLKEDNDKTINFIKEEWIEGFDDKFFENQIIYKKTKDREYKSCIKECIRANNSPKKEGVEDSFVDDNLKLIFNAFSLFKLNETKVLIIGQDPYPSKGNNKGRAHGLAFSFGEEAKKNKPADSLKNIFIAIKAYKDGCNSDNVNVKEIVIGNKKKKPWNTNLKIWAKNNKILLLNTALTYEEDENGNKQKAKHQAVWSEFIKKIITNLLTCDSSKLVVFLWGKDAQELFLECINSYGINVCNYNYSNNIIIDNKRETNEIKRKVLCLVTSHPAPLSCKKGFLVDAPKHFKACDEFIGTNEGKYIWKDFPENNK